MGGSVGQIVSGLIWGASAALATWGSPRQAIICVVVAGFFIYPLTKLALRIVGRSGTLNPANSLSTLGWQIAFTVPLGLLVAGGAALHRLDWFFPAVMILVGAHYLPFAFLYGMRAYLALGGVLAAAGVALGLYLPDAPFATGAWFTSGSLLVFAALTRQQVLREERLDD